MTKKINEINENKDDLKVTTNPEDRQISSKIAIPIILAIALMVAVPFGMIKLLNVANESSDIQVAKKEEQIKEQKLVSTELDLNKKLIEENKTLGFSTMLKNSKPDENYGKATNEYWMTSWKTNFGDIKINLHTTDAPKTVESFVRLNSRKIFEKSIIHRIVKQPNFGVIQGGDFDKKNGQGGQSAFYISENKPNEIPDELWKVKPTINSKEGTTAGGEFTNPKYYTKYDPKTGLVEYQKGLILMAKTSQPDSASSQFFITTTNTVLPAQYTVFGKIDDSSLPTLDRINKEIEPVKREMDENTGEIKSTPTKDGEPSKEIIIEKTEIMPVTNVK